MPLKVILVDDEHDRAILLADALTQAGCAVVTIAASGADLPRRVAELAGDVIIIDVDSPDRDMLEDSRQLTYDQGRPVVMFAQDGAVDTIRAAVEAGVAAYVVDGLRPDRVKPVIDEAIARFRQFQELRSELDKARTSLAERKLVDRAKGILMKRRGCTEDDAYRLLRKMAMDQKLRLVDIANRIIDAAQLLG